MCGHVGIFGSGIRSRDIDVFKELLWLDQLRGKHGTGIGILQGNNSIAYHKMAVSADEYLKSKSFADFEKKQLRPSARAIMGHNRYATVGNTTDSENAHPFMHDSVICAHNGTLDTRIGLAGKDADFIVDSDQLAHTIANKPLEDFIGKVDGAFALVWIDNSREASETGGTINFIRNDARPMWIAKVKGHDVWFYASEKDMISVSANRKNRDYELEFEEVPTGEHWCYDITFRGTEKKVTKYDVPDYDAWKGYAGYSNYNYYPPSTKGSKKTVAVIDAHQAFSNSYGFSKGDTVSFIPEYFRTFGNNLITESTAGYLVGYLEGAPHLTGCVTGITMKEFADKYLVDTDPSVYYGKTVAYTEVYDIEKKDITYFGTYMKNDQNQSLCYTDDANILVPHLVLKDVVKKKNKSSDLMVVPWNKSKELMPSSLFKADYPKCNCCDKAWSNAMLSTVGWFDADMPICSDCVEDLDVGGVYTAAQESIVVE